MIVRAMPGITREFARLLARGLSFGRLPVDALALGLVNHSALAESSLNASDF